MTNDDERHEVWTCVVTGDGVWHESVVPLDFSLPASVEAELPRMAKDLSDAIDAQIIRDHLDKPHP